jgi:hypothetical protein
MKVEEIEIVIEEYDEYVVPPFKQNTREYIICCYDDEG